MKKKFKFNAQDFKEIDECFETEVVGNQFYYYDGVANDETASNSASGIRIPSASRGRNP